MWLFLMSTPSLRSRRWLVPPPHRTAYLSRTRSPGAVLRVSRIVVPVPCDRVHVAPRERGNAAHALHDVEDDTLARKHHARVVDDHRDRLPFAQAHAIEDLGMAGNLGVRGHRAIEGRKDIENAADAAQAGEHAILFGEDGSRSALVGINACVRWWRRASRGLPAARFPGWR